MAVNKQEEIKKKKDGLDVIHDLLRYADSGFDSIDPEHFELFKWYGVYQQRPKTGHFMLRIKLPNGDLQGHQLREIGRITNEFAQGLADITTRQNFQLHWITIDKFPEIFRRLNIVGITTVGACGDDTRNIVGCPVAGIDAEEYFDASPIVKRISAHMTGNRDFSNLPRKYKISIGGCRLHCAQPDINDIGLFGVEQSINGKREVGFGLKVGGGLSTKPYFSADLGVFLRPYEAFGVVHCISEIFRDAEILRQDRGRARLKFLLHDPKIGIGAAKFRELIEAKLGYKLTDGGPYSIPKQTELDHLGIRAQKQAGRYYVGIGVTAGRLTGDDLLRMADLSDEFSMESNIRNTNKQNFIITNVQEAKLESLKARLDEYGLNYKPSEFTKGVISCTGIEFCNLAVTETKELARRVALDMEERFPGATKQIRVHFSGCPNNCGQNSIADIGLRGGRTKLEGQTVEAFDILLGGATGGERAFAEVASKKIPALYINDAIANLYREYLDWCKNGETFQEYVKAHTMQELDAVARTGLPIPPPPARPSVPPAVTTPEG